jgi:hypothetical protein
MKPADKIKDLIDKADVRTTSRADKRILGSALEYLERLKQQRSAPGRSNSWRTIMKSRTAKLSAAAVVIMGVCVAVHFVGSPMESVAWAELVQRVERSHNEYYAELLLAMEEKDVGKVSARADALSEFWQGMNSLAEEGLESTADALDMLRHESFNDRFQEFEQQIFMVYAENFIAWMNKIEDAAWINEIIHVCRQMEEYAEEIRLPGRLPELDFSYAEHCLPSFVRYCEWFEQLPWDNPEQVMTPAMLLTGIRRDLEIARREIEAREIRGVIPFIERSVQQARKNVLDLDAKTASGRTKKQRDLARHLLRRIDELCALITYAEIASQDYLEQIIRENRYDTDAETFDQVLTEEFGDKGPFADYYIERIDQSLDLCDQLSEGLESEQ